ncbi:hypothetical protein A2W24_02965 [Microgenomates group bacterium RBG_16_45_19]|nr:MAG: hypothetical protein A2W24_02965 [Microgenomates group bacterium RBG_16_45_19]
MRLRSRSYPSPALTPALGQPWLKRLCLYSIILMFVGLGDAIMTYFSPVYINRHLNNEMIMGLIIATSSMVGLACDILFGEFFSGKPHSFFLLRSIAVAGLFSLSFIFFPPLVALLILSMALWGIYYELILFSDFHFINHALDHPHHSLGWSIIKMFTGLAYLIGPLIAGFLLTFNETFPPLGALVMFLVAFSLFLIFRPRLDKRSPADIHQTAPKRNLLHEFKVWRLLLPKLWPVMLFILILTMMDAAFWTVGSVLADTMNHGGFLVVAYMLPSLFAGYLAARFSPRYGKKRTAFVTGLICGCLFALSGLTAASPLFVILIFVASIFQGMAMPEIFGAIEDYLERMGHSANTLVGLENSTTSLAFIIGPIFAGLIASVLSELLMFSVFGLLIAGISLLALLIVPRKIHLPQTALNQVGS